MLGECPTRTRRVPRAYVHDLGRPNATELTMSSSLCRPPDRSPVQAAVGSRRNHTSETDGHNETTHHNWTDHPHARLHRQPPPATMARGLLWPRVALAQILC